ncbi:patatin-like phospholipase family protein [Virgibacillus ainsalahensis]
MEDNIGLILEGGGMRGAYTSGVLDFFHDEGIDFPLVTSASSAAIIGSSYIAKQRGRNYEILMEMGKNHKSISFERMIREKELFSMDFIFDKIPNELVPFDYESFSKAASKFIIGTTDLNTGSTVYHDSYGSKEDLLSIIRASCSLPILAPSISYKGNNLMDGGIGEAIPIKPSIDRGYRRHVVILSRNRGYIKKATKLNWLYKRVFKKHPEFAKLLKDRHILYNRTIKTLLEMEKRGEVFLIQPEEPLKVSRIEKSSEKLDQLYIQGYTEAKEKSWALQQFFTKQAPYYEKNMTS